MEKHSHKGILALTGIVMLAFLLRIWKYFLDPSPLESLASYWISTAVAVGIIIIIYLLSYKITESYVASLFSSALAATIPIYSWRTVAQLTHTTAVLLFFLSLLSFLYVKEFKDWKPLIVVPLLFAFIHVYALLLIPIVILYAAFVKIEKREINKSEIYLFTVSGIAILVIFVFFTATPALLALVQQYININYYSFAVENFSISKTFAVAGLVPTYVGAFGLYLAMKEKKKAVLLLTSALAILLLTIFFNAIPIRLGLPYFSLTLAVLAGFFWKEIDDNVEKTRLKKYKPIITLVAFGIILVSGIVHFIA